MRQRVVTQHHDFVGYLDSIQFQQGDTSGTAVWILDCNVINSVLETVSQTEVRPIFRYNWVDCERVAAALETQTACGRVRDRLTILTSSAISMLSAHDKA